MLRLPTSLLLLACGQVSSAANIHVPKDHATIQAAIDSAASGDTILVDAGRYSERVRLREGITLRSSGDDSPGQRTLKRAEETIIDGGGKNGDRPGVAMAEGSTLDGFTVTNVGVFDEAYWKKHFDTQGEELGDDEGSTQAEGTVPAVSIRGANCTVTHNVVHHNGDVGIAIVGVKGHRTAPVVLRNISHRNLGGGIGVAEQAEPLIRGNTCTENLRAGIGCRNADPQLLDNACTGNVRAGIGCREGSRPLIRGNTCTHNRRAGIGIRMSGTSPIVEKNICSNNERAGIGLRDGATAVIRANQCLENKLVAIGVTEGCTATIIGNTLVRTEGGAPPLIGIRDASTATIEANTLSGGGVAAVLVQGKAVIADNSFTGNQSGQKLAIWVWDNSTATISENSFTGYATAVKATKARLVILGNTISNFRSSGIVVADSTSPPYIVDNIAVASEPGATAVKVTGTSGVVDGNTVKPARE